MGKKIYLGNLSYRTTEEQLEAKLSEFGDVDSVKIITDRETGQSKGFGFAEMRTDAAARAAIDALNGKDLDGRTLKVNEARPQERTPRRPSSW